MEGTKEIFFEDLNKNEIELCNINRSFKSENGIPHYWKKVLINCNKFKKRINYKDLDVLNYLKEIKVSESGSNVLLKLK